ncbi:MAG: hypothetical protein PQJ50_12805 [Spirochaetales bacterium]|nr:hypothetical protein [Spirochaetales bacterium]
MLNELLDLNGKVLQETSHKDLGFQYTVPFIEVKRVAIEKDINVLGIITEDSKTHLAPSNVAVFSPVDRLIYL